MTASVTSSLELVVAVAEEDAFSEDRSRVQNILIELAITDMGLL